MLLNVITTEYLLALGHNLFLTEQLPRQHSAVPNNLEYFLQTRVLDYQYILGILFLYFFIKSLIRLGRAMALG